ncbi:cobalt/nickel transport system permease protein [Halogranum amylolyticum]|uniref:Cobalt/nickel transport system permease protein n=1 Tax=Halogranum amylolyticum TaxID=660520 RepID=A0A1H8W388_9EURY|nr:energy-coupling factor ABC transporter permease [Halogranum amylolyticum]SEP21927.1 cobalt/nickel transport system permease protein [Halogranum amylolyticum]
MHIPDGFLDLSIAAGCFVLAGAVLAFAARRAEETLDDVRVPLLGVVSAGIFAAQMLNWPIPGGTSAHFVGGAFAAIALGPHLGALSVASVVVIQSLVFGDGGLTAIGANVLNMAVVEVYAGYAVYRALRGVDESLAVFAAGWLGITLGALAAAVQLGLSSTFAYQLGTTVAIMGVGHLVLGLVEGAITLVVYRYIVQARPDVLATTTEREVTA